MAEGPIQLNLHHILRSRFKDGMARMVPGFLISALERLIHQDELNELLRVGYPAEGSEFGRRVLGHLGIEIECEGLDTLPLDHKYVFASNHPLGGLDGITLVSVLGQRFGDDNIRVLVNDLLMNVTPFAKVFLPINKFGSQGKEAAREINRAYEEGKQIVMFPAGLVSRLHADGTIADLEWQKAFVAKAMAYDRHIVPVRFEALNSMRFYRIARWRKRLGLKFNIEQTLLPSEIFRAKGKRFRIIFGTPISPEELRTTGKTPKEKAAEIRSRIYGKEYGKATSKSL